MWKAYCFLRTLYTAVKCYWEEYKSAGGRNGGREVESEGEQLIKQELESGKVVFSILS